MIVVWVLVVAVVLVYAYTKWERGHFERRGVRSLPIEFPLVGHMYSVMSQKEHIKDFTTRMYNAFPGDRYIGILQFNSTYIQIRDLDLLKKVLVTDFDHFQDHMVAVDERVDAISGNNLFSLKGKKWRDMRATLSPTFTSSKMKAMFQYVAEISEQVIYYLNKKLEEPENKERGLLEVEMKDIFTRYANDVIGTSAFGIKVNSLEEPNNKFYEIGKEVTNFSGFQLFKIFLIFSCPKLMMLTGMKFFKKEVRTFFHDLVINGMKKRETEGIVRHDMVHLLKQARDGALKYEATQNENIGAGFAAAEESNLGKQVVNRNWNDDEIVAQAVVFLIAGFDSASSLLSFMAHELTLNQDAQKKLQEEIDEIVSKNGKKITYNDLANMKYMDMVVTETLRMWPPVIATDRVCIKPYKLPPSSDSDKEGYAMSPGDGITIPIYALHHDPKYYPEPEKFIPERFSDENKPNIKQGTFIPFGMGPRNCIGSRFALMEAKAVMFHLLANFNFVKTAKTEDPITLKASVFNFNSKNGYWIGLKPRKE